MDPFSHFNIDHLSASSLNLYSEEPAFWSLVYLHGFKDEAGPAAWRGTAVEAGIDTWLYRRDPQEALQNCLSRFEQDAVGELSDKISTERDCLPGFFEQATRALQSYKEPIGRQLKIEYWFDGIEVPLIGYIDYEFEEEGIDLKTTKRMPTEAYPRHCRQVSLYQAARKKSYKLLYVTDKKHSIREVENADTHLKRLEWYAHSVRRLLSVFPDKHDASRIFAPNFDSFYWNETAKQLAKDIWE